MFVAVEGLAKSYQGRAVLRGVGFTVERGEMVSIVGPSGVGKTTLLRILAGLEKPDAGRVAFAEPPTRERPVILVFQDYLLFPNLSVFENTAFGLRARRLPKDRVRAKVDEVLDYFHLADKAGHFPNQLSAGQKQRVAIARAMVVEPAMLLLDEPFANLDRNLKLETAEFIRATQQRFGVTTLSVTHDLEEAFAMSDKIGIMLDGELAQFAPAGEVYHRPATYETARFLGPVNNLQGEVCRLLGLDREADCNDQPLYVRPEALRITPDPDGPGTVLGVSFAGHYIKYAVDVAGQALTVYGLEGGLRRGDRVRLEVARWLAPDRNGNNNQKETK